MPLTLSGDIAGLGKVVQIVRATDGTSRSTTSSTFVDVTGMSVTITPQKNDSAILLIATFYAGVTTSGGGYTSWFSKYSITDSSNNAISGAEGATTGSGIAAPGVSAPEELQHVTLIGYATPATTSATTYKLRFRSSLASFVTAFVYNASNTGQMYAIEVAA